ncbi:MAG: hypothetical protein FVQ79_07060 [Planctomycetes bacterium]|nr:hypothetical protein [Planctomycetota bacterium]
MNSLITFLNSTGKTFIDFSGPMLIQSSVLIIVLLLADMLVRKKVRAVFRYCVWMLILVKLVLPTTLSAPTGLGYWFGDITGGLVNEKPVAAEHITPILPGIEPASETAGLETAIAALPSSPAGQEPVISKSYESEAAASGAGVSLSWEGFVFLGWVAVITAMVLLLVQRMFFVRGLIAQSKTPSGSIVDIFEKCRGEMGSGRRSVLKLSPVAASPSVCGLFRPTITYTGKSSR